MIKGNENNQTMSPKMKNALLFGGLLELNFVIIPIFLEENFFSKISFTHIISFSLVALAGGYIFGFILKGSFGWKNKYKETKDD